MAFLHANSCECTKSELDLFTLPPTQTSIEHGQWIQYKPLSSLTNDSPIEFSLPAMSDSYMDLAHTLLYIKARIVKPDGTAISATDTPVIPVNNFLHSLFSQVDIFWNQKLVSSPCTTYGYRAYLETLLNYGRDAKESHLTTSLWYTDTAGKMNNFDEADSGFAKRMTISGKSASIEMISPIHADVFNQAKFLVNGVELRLRFVRSRDSFSLMGNAEGLVNIQGATIFIRRVKINPIVLLAHSKTLASTTAKYPVTRVEVKVLTISDGVGGKSLDNVFLGQIPKRVIIGFTSNKAFNGDYKLNPFNFQNYNMNFLSLYVDGEMIPSRPLQSNFGSSEYIQAYHTLFSGTGIHFSNSGQCISRENYSSGFCLSVFDLTPDLSANLASHWSLIRTGCLRIDVRFSEVLTETVNCIVYAEFDNVIEICNRRNVTLDYGS